MNIKFLCVNNFFMNKIAIYIILFFICFTYNINLKEDNFYAIFKDYTNISFCYVFDKKLFSIEDEIMRKNTSGMFFQKNGTKNMLYFKKGTKNILKSVPEYYQAKYYATFKNLILTIKSLKLNIIEQDNIDGRLIIYAYSPFWKNFKIVKNKKVNFQFAFYDNVVTVGHPMIYYSF